MRHNLNPSQAQLLGEIEIRLQAVKREREVALTLIGVDPAKVVGGDLVKEPHLLIEDEC
jgi:hypothetical protein